MVNTVLSVPDGCQRVIDFAQLTCIFFNFPERSSQQDPIAFMFVPRAIRRKARAGTDPDHGSGRL
jgi:hypothetical protein